MSHSRFPSRIDSRIRLALAAAALVGCGGGGGNDAGSDAGNCGPGTAPRAGLVASAAAVTLTFGGLSSGLNNDCPDSAAPAGVVSLTIFGSQSDGSGAITLCVSRPDLLAGQAQTLGPDAAGSQVRVVDLAGTNETCEFDLDRTRSITGNATSKGLCSNGSDPMGFALTLDGAATLTRTCSGTVDSVQVTLHGTAAVAGGTPF